MHCRRKWQPTRSCLENPRDGGAWWAAVYGIAQSRTRLERLSSSSRYADDTTLMAESEEELKSLLMKVNLFDQDNKPINDTEPMLSKTPCELKAHVSQMA